jgi:threonine/homoserine/homoserine lactone efflux protein
VVGIHDYWMFVATGVLLNLTPGQDTFYVLGRSIAQGTRIGVASALGITAGSLAHTAMAAIGLSAILATSARAFAIIKFVGAAYLVYLGVRMLMARRSATAPSPRGRVRSSLTAFRDGALTNILNPKVALFFLALMPQFIHPNSHAKVLAFILLGLTFVTTGTLWCLVLAISAGRARDLFTHHPKRINMLSRASGALFMLLGLRLAVTRNA